MADSYDNFTPILVKLYELMGRLDLMKVYNLSMNNVEDDM